MTIEDAINNIESHLKNFDKQKDKKKLLTTCTKLLTKISEDINITTELLGRITQLQGTINTLEDTLHEKQEQKSGSGEAQAKSEAKEDDGIDNDWDKIDAASEEVDEADHDWVQVDNKGNETPNIYPSTATSSMPSFAPSSVPSSTFFVPEHTLSTSHIRFAGATFGSSLNKFFPGNHFQQDPDGDGGIY